MGITTIVRQYLEQHSWMTLEQYMEYALYHPEHGYYMKTNEKIGKNGDFYTSSSVSDVFGKIWANVFANTISKYSLDPVVVEFGAGNGRFAKHVLSAWEEDRDEHPITYIIVERSPYHRQLLQEELEGHSVTVLSSLDDLKENYPEFKGIIFANEVLDAFPLRIFQNRENGWYEKTVVFNKKENQLEFKFKKIEDIYLTGELENFFSSRKNDSELEVSFQMLNWLNSIYEWTRAGTVYYFIDYGYKSNEWNKESLKYGSIRGYYKHQIENDPLSYPGEMDITYHVNWGQVENAAEKHGVQKIDFNVQGEFLLKEGLLLYLKESQQTDPFSVEHRRNRAIRSFLLDSTLANGFQILQQKKRSV